jgi:IS30 family transposase
VSREVARNGGRHRYRALRADRAAWQRARRPKVGKLFENVELRGVVEEKLVVVAAADLGMAQRDIPWG